MDVTAKLTMTRNEATGKWTIGVPSFETMGVTGGGRLTLTAVTVECTHTRTALVDVCEACCIHEGYTGDTACQDCGFILTYGTKTSAEATEHSGLTLVEGTAKTGSCTEYGYEGDYVCGVCGDTVRGKRQSKVHGETYLDGYVAPTCTAEGYTGDERCTSCNGMVKRGTSLPVQHGELELRDQNPDVCVGSGYSGNKVCKDCGAVVESGYATPALGHDWDAGKLVTLSGYRGGTFKRYTCQRCGEQNDVRVLRAGGVDGKVIKSANFELSGFALGSTKAGIELTPDEATAAVMNIRYDICKQSPVLAGDLRDDYVPTLQSGEQIEAGRSYWLRVEMLTRNGYTYAEKAFASLNGTKVASFFGDSTITVGTGKDAIKVPVKVAVFKLDRFPAYTVTVDGSTAETTGAGRYGEGETVTIDAGTKSGYTFNGWTGTDGVTFADAASTRTTFTMPGNSVTVFANWKPVKPTEPEEKPTKPVNPITPVAPGKPGKPGETVKPGEPAEPTTPVQPEKPTFTDVLPGSWYEDAVQWAVENGITTGVSDTLFAPDLACTRAQAVTFLWRAAGSPAPTGTTMPFEDVAAGSYCYDAVQWAVENGITLGTSDTAFSPDLECDRAQIVTFLHRFAVNRGMDVSVGEDTNILSYADALTIPDYAFTAMQWACGEGVMQGDGEYLLPNSSCTRAQIVTFLYRFMN